MTGAAGPRAALAACIAGLILILAGAFLVRPALAAGEPWLPISQVMTELSHEPGFQEAVARRLGHSPKAFGILGPDEIRRLRELILGRNFEALDRFPGLTVQGMGRAIRLAALAGPSPGPTPSGELSEPGEEAAPEPLRIPSGGPPTGEDAYLQELGFGLVKGDRVDPVLAARHGDARRLADLLNGLSRNPAPGEPGARMQVSFEGGHAETPEALLAGLAASGHDIEIRDARYFANFGDLIYGGRDVLTAFWLDTRIRVPGTDRTLLVPASHSQHEVIVRGPLVNADLSFYFGIDGEVAFRPIDTLDQAWVLGRVAHRYRDVRALEVVHTAGAIIRAYDAAERNHPDLPFGGYYALGVCNDVNAMIEIRMQGATTLFPLTLDPALFAGTGEVEALARLLPIDSRPDSRADPARVLGSIPVENLALLPLPDLRRDLESVRDAWQRDDLEFAGVGLSLLAAAILSVLALLSGLYRIFRRRVHPS